jgi:hypothetical protein
MRERFIIFSFSGSLLMPKRFYRLPLKKRPEAAQ